MQDEFSHLHPLLAKKLRAKKHASQQTELSASQKADHYKSRHFHGRDGAKAYAMAVLAHGGNLDTLPAHIKQHVSQEEIEAIKKDGQQCTPHQP